MEVIIMSKIWTIVNTISCARDESVYEVRHALNGLKVLYIKRKDFDRSNGFSLSIKTPVYSNKGISHVVEHCVGNDILSDPIAWNYIESSVCNYKFYTLLDRTVYECFCKNKNIFDFLLERTLQCVYQPSIYDESDVFYTEACRKKINPDGSAQVNGVVFNEMRQALNGPNSLLRRIIPLSLGICDFISGGTPEGISKLTYEETLNYHKKYYQLSNSYLVIYANEDLEVYLEKIERIISEFCMMIRREYLEFKKEKPGLEIGERKYVCQGLDTLEVPLQNLKNRYVCSVNFLLDKPDKVQKYLLYNKFKYIFSCKALKKYAGMGKVILNTGIEYPYIGFALPLCRREDVSSFCNDLMKLFSNEDELQLFLDNNFLSNNEYSIEVWEKWIVEVFVYDMNIEKFIKSTEEKNVELSKDETKWLQMKNSVVLLRPGKNVVSQPLTKSNYFNSAPAISRHKVKYVNIVPHNSIDIDNQDVIEQARKIWTDRKIELNYKNKTVRLYSNDKHDGYTYLFYYCDIDSLIKKNIDVINLNLAAKAILENAIEKKEYIDIKNKKGIVNVHVICCEDNLNPNNVRIKLLIIGKIMCGNERILLDFIKNMFMVEKNIDNVVQDIFEMQQRIFEENLYSNPDVLLRRRFKASCSRTGVVEEATSGIFMYENICNQTKDVSIDYIDIAIKELSDAFSLPAELSVYTDLKIENEIMSFIKETDYCELSYMPINILKPMGKNEGFYIPFSNQYIAKGGNYKCLGYRNTGLIVLFSYLVNVEYFRKRVRSETGAYSSFMRHYADGTLIFESINDPGLEISMKRINELPAFLNTLTFEKMNVDKIKKEAVQKYIIDFVTNNVFDNKTIKYLKNVTWEYVEEQIHIIMDATEDDFLDFVRQIEYIISQNCYCIMGNEQILKHKKNAFSVINQLPINIY